MGFTYDYPHPAVSADVALLREKTGSLELLLVRRRKPPYKDHWALPGGFVEIDEDLEPAARRELVEESGLQAGPLRQLVTIGTPDRDPRERVITVVYIGFAADPAQAPAGGDDAADARWFSLDALPALAFDHDDIVGLIRDAVESDAV